MERDPARTKVTSGSYSLWVATGTFNTSLAMFSSQSTDLMAGSTHSCFDGTSDWIASYVWRGKIVA
jgi:hypothetical protein